MRKVILYSAMSVDGFIAKKNGSVDWLENPDYEIEGEDFGYAKFYASIDTVLMGNKTYQQVLGFDVPYPYPDKKNYVFTSRNSQKDEFAQLISDDPASFVKSLKNEPGKDIWLVGGGIINGVLMSEHLIDEIKLSVIPVFLGEGIPLFGSYTSSIQLHLQSSKTFQNGIVQTVYTCAQNSVET